jgi:hypothetical protein
MDNGHSLGKDRFLRFDLPINGQLADDTLCYTVRSYVVARDSKDSDSVHLTRYSTCQPASRYRLRTTQAKKLSFNR